MYVFSTHDGRTDGPTTGFVGGFKPRSYSAQWGAALSIHNRDMTIHNRLITCIIKHCHIEYEGKRLGPYCA